MNDVIDWGDTPETTDLIEHNTSDAVQRNPDDEVATLIQYDAEGNKLVSEVNFSTPELDEETARAITDRIKTTTNVLYLLVKRAHAGKAYKALGYSSFEKYIKEEFNFSKAYAYRLLNQADVIEAIQAKAPEGTKVYVSEPVSKKIKKVLPELLEEVETATADIDDPHDAGALIEEIINEHRERQEEAEELSPEDDDYDPTSGDNSGGGTGQGNYPDDEFDDPDEVEDTDDDESISGFEEAEATRRKFEKIYSLYSGLKTLNSIGDGEEIIAFLPQERIDEISSLLENVIPWLSEFEEKFKTFISESSSDTDEEDDSETGD